VSATTPEALHRLWAEGVNRGDLDALDTLYEPDAAFVTKPGTVVSGRAAIREANAGLLALKPRATLELLTSVCAGDLALLVSRWSLAGTGDDGAPVTVAGQTSDVARRQADGTWRFAIDNPWGDGIAGA
jgi:uncharacterized protein (TIGR02246 family)